VETIPVVAGVDRKDAAVRTDMEHRGIMIVPIELRIQDLQPPRLVSVQVIDPDQGFSLPVPFYPTDKKHPIVQDHTRVLEPTPAPIPQKHLELVLIRATVIAGRQAVFTTHPEGKQPSEKGVTPAPLILVSRGKSPILEKISNDINKFHII
jgi:hypothetical protein